MGIDYAKDLSDLMTKKGDQVLRLYLNWTGTETQGLLHYLRGEELHIVATEAGDCLYAGGISRFTPELCGSIRFQELLEFLKKRYHWILIITDAQPMSAGAESLFASFSLAAITVQRESIEDLHVYLNQSDKHIIFLFN
jgi:hypothetical protein